MSVSAIELGELLAFTSWASLERMIWWALPSPLLTTMPAAVATAQC